MNKKLAILMCGFVALSLFAQDFAADEYVYRESKRLKTSGIVALTFGTLTAAAGITTIAQNYKEIHKKDANIENKAGGYVVGGLITTMGIGVDLLAIPIFKHRKEMVQNARGDAQAHLIVNPRGVSFALTF